MLQLRQYSGMYAGTDKKPALLRDFSCIDFGMGENCPFYTIISCFLYTPHFPIVKKRNKLNLYAEYL